VHNSRIKREFVFYLRQKVNEKEVNVNHCRWCSKECREDYCCDRHEKLCLDYPVLFQGGMDGEEKEASEMVAQFPQEISGVL
jgi:hypothetical protein